MPTASFRGLAGGRGRATAIGFAAVLLAAAPTAAEEPPPDPYRPHRRPPVRAPRLFYRLALTENLANFENTPDIGVTLSLAKVVFGD